MHADITRRSYFASQTPSCCSARACFLDMEQAVYVVFWGTTCYEIVRRVRQLLVFVETHKCLRARTSSASAGIACEHKPLKQRLNAPRCISFSSCAMRLISIELKLSGSHSCTLKRSIGSTGTGAWELEDEEDEAIGSQCTNRTYKMPVAEEQTKSKD